MAATETVPDAGGAQSSTPQASPRVEGECDFFRYGNCYKGEHCPCMHIEANKGCDRHLGHPTERPKGR
eukprot:2542221-Alexandrium_andersonii.AAC.1